MKQTLLTIAMFMAALFGAQAQTSKTYTDKLTVTINHASSAPQSADVNVIVNGNTMDLTLKNFMLANGEDKIPVGNIAVTGMELKPSVVGDFKVFERSETIMLEEGDAELSDFWLATSLNELGGVPIILKGQIDDNKLYVTIDIDMMSTLQQIIYVEVGSNLTARTYTDNLTVTINDASSQPQPATVTVTSNEDGTMGLTLKNFMLANGEDKIPVGNINVDGLTLTPSTYGTYNTFERTETIFLGTGDPELSDFWLAPTLNDLGGVPIVLRGQINEEQLYVTIDINMESTLGQIIYVKVGEPWEEKAPVFYTVTFVVDGQTISSEQVEEGAAITVPTIEEREGYTFAWDGEVPATATADVTINGAYTINQYTITWMVDGEVYETQTLDYGTAITAPTVTVEDRIFDGWGEVPATMPAHDVTVNGSTHLDALKSITTSSTTKATIYDLSGRRVNSATRGIVIINGKKLVK